MLQCGIHGTSDSSTMTVRIGEQRARLEAEMHRMARGQTNRARIVRDHGIAQRSARCASAGTASAGSAAVTISGRSAAAIHSASVAIDRGSGCVARGLRRAARIGAIGSGSGADSGSRGSTR